MTFGTGSFLSAVDLGAWVAIGKDVALGVAAVVGATVALRGLDTWRRQLRGSVEYELARRLLRCTYRWRETIKSVRRPMVWAYEMPAPPNEDREAMSEEDVQHYGYATAYQNRWEKVVEARDELQTELLEAEVLWGKEINTRYNACFALEKELWVYLLTHLESRNPRARPGMQEAKERVLANQRDVLRELSSVGDEDAFSRDVSAAIARIEDFLKPRLRK